MVRPGGRYKAATIALRMLRIQCFFGHWKDSGSGMDGETVQVTYDGNDQPKEYRRESHHQVDFLSPRYSVPLCITSDEEQRNKDTYRMA